MSELTGKPAADAADVCQPFVIAGGAYRGRLVRLSRSVTEILGRHDDPEPVARLLAECMVAAVALATGLKYEGIFTLQMQSDGAVGMLVTDFTSDGDLRGCAKFDRDKVARQDPPTTRLLGAGHLAFTVDQGPDTDRYQGIVELAGSSVAESIHQYFRQSEQIDSAIKIAVAPPTAQRNSWVAAALLIQRMPEGGGVRPPMGEDAEDAWRTAVILLSSLKDTELLDLGLAANTVLARIFGTIGVSVLRPRPVNAGCRCSRERSERILASFPVEEVRSLAENGVVRMTCEFCRTDYDFPVGDLDLIAERHRAGKRAS